MEKKKYIIAAAIIGVVLAAAIIIFIIISQKEKAKPNKPDITVNSNSTSVSSTAVQTAATSNSSQSSFTTTDAADITSTSVETKPNTTAGPVQTNPPQTNPPQTNPPQTNPSQTNPPQTNAPTQDVTTASPVTEAPNNDKNPWNYSTVTKNGYKLERIDGITYVDGIMMANKTYTLPKTYDPGIQPVAADAFYSMQAAAAAEGINLFIVSAYRSYAKQEAVYAGWVNQDGREAADTYSSRPGHSDHQTGYTFDLNSLSQSFADTKEGKWIAAHCAEYGFIIRYPKDKDMYTGYMYEPWHVRYIGVEKAKIITDSGLSLEEYYGITSDYADCKD